MGEIRKVLQGNTINGMTTPDGRSILEHLAEHYVAHAMKGSPAHGKELLDRIDGKIPDAETEPEIKTTDVVSKAQQKRNDRLRTRKPDGPIS